MAGVGDPPVVGGRPVGVVAVGVVEDQGRSVGGVDALRLDQQPLALGVVDGGPGLLDQPVELRVGVPAEDAGRGTGRRRVEEEVQGVRVGVGVRLEVGDERVVVARVAALAQRGRVDPPGGLSRGPEMLGGWLIVCG